MKKELYIPLLVLLLTINCMANNLQYANTTNYYNTIIGQQKISVGALFGYNLVNYKNYSDNHIPVEISERYDGLNIDTGIFINYSINKNNLSTNHYLFSNLNYEGITLKRIADISDFNYIKSISNSFAMKTKLSQFINLSYLNMDFGYEFHLIGRDNEYISIPHIGVEISYLLSSKQYEIMELTTSDTSSFNKDIPNYIALSSKKIEYIHREISNVNNFRFSIPIGLNTTFFWGNSNLGFGFEYCIPLTNLIENEDSKLKDMRVFLCYNYNLYLPKRIK